MSVKMTSEKRRQILMTVCGISLNGIAVGMFNFSDFGMDPFQVFAHGLWNLAPLGFGTFYMMLNLVLLAGMFFLDRGKIGLGTFINLFLLGYVAEFSGWVWDTLFPHPGLAIKCSFLLAGILLISLAAALYFTADLGVSTYDVIALRIATDVICVAIGFSLHATVGIGTLVTAFFMGPVIAFFRKYVSEPLRYGKAGAVSV